MTDQQWIELQVGDVVIDHLCGDARREVLKVSRISGTRGMREGAVRTNITVANLKSAGATTVLCSTSDSPAKSRFELVPKDGAV